MGQLTRQQQEDQTRGRMIEVAMVMKKVEINLSREQLAALGRIMSRYLANLRLFDIDSKAIFYLLWAIYENRVRKKMLSIKPTVKLSLDMAQAWAMEAMLVEINLSAWPYEKNLGEFIVSEIVHQTA
jgi:hypothetical protein